MAQANNNTVLDHGINESDDAGDHNLSKVPPDNSIATEAGGYLHKRHFNSRFHLTET
jgi:hypothetical protein